ncbi:hypothetical protein BJ170DRAFT_282256 [Xylariales sp. AK1849]|nr:hypothetical protein BJ170DRAFT_282256 [Xylariales sp. AK1849]
MPRLIKPRCIESSAVCCDSGEKACGTGCIPSGGDCCGGGSGYCDPGKKCCDGRCIVSGTPCCDAGEKVCGAECIAIGADCCSTKGDYCDAGKKCCKDGCNDADTPCCEDGDTVCVTGCMPSSSYCCTAEGGGYCSSGSTCSASYCYTTFTPVDPTTTFSGAAAGGFTSSVHDATTATPDQLTTLTLILTTVDVTTPSTNHGPTTTAIAEPLYKGSGSLLTGACAVTSSEFTLIDGGSTVYYAPFVGCVADRPECCPWKAGTAINTSTASSSGGPDETSGSPGLAGYPQPENGGQAVLSKCPVDYYPISGSCCPSNFAPYGQDVGGATPAFSSLITLASAPDLTAGMDSGTGTGLTLDWSAKPTSAVVNVVWAMQYPVATPAAGMSIGAKIGVGVTVPVGVIAIGLLSLFLWRARRKNRKLEQSSQTPAGSHFPQQPPPMIQHPASFHRNQSISNASAAFSQPSHMSSDQPMVYGRAAGSGAGAVTAGWHQDGHPSSYCSSSAASPVHEMAGNVHPSPASAEVQSYSGSGNIQQPAPQYPPFSVYRDQPGGNWQVNRS